MAEGARWEELMEGWQGLEAGEQVGRLERVEAKVAKAAAKEVQSEDGKVEALTVVAVRAEAAAAEEAAATEEEMVAAGRAAGRKAEGCCSPQPPKSCARLSHNTAR